MNAFIMERIYQTPFSRFAITSHLSCVIYYKFNNLLTIFHYCSVNGYKLIGLHYYLIGNLNDFDNESGRLITFLNALKCSFLQIDLSFLKYEKNKNCTEVSWLRMKNCR